MPILNYYKLRDMIRKRCMGDWRMRVEFNPVSFRNNHKIDLNVQNDSNIALELPVDSFENSETEEYNELLFGPYGHPYSGRSIISKTGSQEKKLSFFKWLSIRSYFFYLLTASVPDIEYLTFKYDIVVSSLNSYKCFHLVLFWDF